MKFRLGNEVDADLSLKDLLIAIGISVAAFGGLALFKWLLMMI